MASDAATGSIADRVAQTLTAFNALDALEAQAEFTETQYVWAQGISDQLSKFKLWAGNIGAHRTGRGSLDYRLRDSSHLHKQVVRLLDDLISSLNEAHSILSGETLPWEQYSGEAGEVDEELKDLLMNEEFEFDSELGQLTKEIADVISNLLRLSISLRNPAPHDRFMSTEYAKVRYFEPNDKAHVEAKFPKASQGLMVRLGQALSQRRQYFRYRESHHQKLSRGLFDSGRPEADGKSTVASSVPLAMKGAEAVPVFGELDEDEHSDTGFSQTSFATTAPDSERLRIPPLPKKSYDGPFECPFCFMLISVSSTYQWKKHVLRDLRPYICLAEDCPTSSKEYGRRHEWMSHMLQKHWKTWSCPYQCGLNDLTETSVRKHVTKVHGPVTQMELDAMIGRCGKLRPPSPSLAVHCPLCQDTLESLQQYQRHVGRHQVDLALFALPKIEDDDEEFDERSEHQESISTNSGSYSEAMSDEISTTALAEPARIIDGMIEEEHQADIGSSELTAPSLGVSSFDFSDPQVFEDFMRASEAGGGDDERPPSALPAPTDTGMRVIFLDANSSSGSASSDDSKVQRQDSEWPAERASPNDPFTINGPQVIDEKFEYIKDGTVDRRSRSPSEPRPPEPSKEDSKKEAVKSLLEGVQKQVGNIFKKREQERREAETRQALEPRGEMVDQDFEEVFTRKMTRHEAYANARQLELEVRQRNEFEIATAAAAEAAARVRRAAAIKAGEEAKAAAGKKAAEEVEWRKNLEEEAKLKADLEARKKMEDERAAAEAERGVPSYYRDTDDGYIPISSGDLRDPATSFPSDTPVRRGSSDSLASHIERVREDAYRRGREYGRLEEEISEATERRVRRPNSPSKFDLPKPEPDRDEESQMPRGKSEERKRVPARAYQFGNTVIVEDDDDEVIKQYDLLPAQQSEDREYVATNLRDMGISLVKPGDNETKPKESSQAGPEAVRPTAEQSRASRSSEREEHEPDDSALDEAEMSLERQVRQRKREEDEKERELERAKVNLREATEKEYQLKRTLMEYKEAELLSKLEQDKEHLAKVASQERELRLAKEELDELREKRDTLELEARIEQQRGLELDAALAEKKQREREAIAAVERYKKEEAERELREKIEAERRDREYKQRMKEQLRKSGLDEMEIEVILEGKKIENPKPQEMEQQKLPSKAIKGLRNRWTRMSRRHLSVETLRKFDIDWVLDEDPEYILIKRWVPEPEQDVLWRHTRQIRAQRAGETL